MTIEVEQRPTQPYGEDSPEYMSGIPEGVGKLGFNIGPSNKGLLEEVLPIRRRFVEAMGWLPEEQPSADLLTGDLAWLSDGAFEDIRKDVDRYDASDDTIHLSMKDREKGNIMATLRLTRIDSVEESLSFQMLNGNTRMKNEVREYCDELNGSASRGNLWDLTRLAVPVDGTVDPSTMAAGIMELFAAGYGVIKNNTAQGQESDVRWICNATELVKLLADRLCIQTMTATHGLIRENDPTPSYFLMVRVQEAVQHIVQNAEAPGYRFPHKHMDDGLRKANAL